MSKGCSFSWGPGVMGPGGRTGQYQHPPSSSGCFHAFLHESRSPRALRLMPLGYLKLYSCTCHLHFGVSSAHSLRALAGNSASSSPCHHLPSSWSTSSSIRMTYSVPQPLYQHHTLFHFRGLFPWLHHERDQPGQSLGGLERRPLCL